LYAFKVYLTLLSIFFHFQLAEKYLPVQKPEFVNISIPVADLAPKNPDFVDDRHVAADDDYQPITMREEVDFVRMLNEFSLGISEAARFHERLTKRLQDLDNTNIESIMTSEQAVTKLIEDLDKCEERMEFLGERLVAYDAVLNVSFLFVAGFFLISYFSKSNKV
jgi:hypothetical protein